MYKQIIIARKDLNLSPGKLAAQCSHASIAFLTSLMKNGWYIEPKLKAHFQPWGAEPQPDWNDVIGYEFSYLIPKDLYEQWICGEFTKCILEARNKDHLLKVKSMAEEMGMFEGDDFFLIKDNCHTELQPEEFDEDGVGRTLTCIGFKPMDAEIIDEIGKKYQLYR